MSAGGLTFLFTDIEGSTRLAYQLGDSWFGVLQEHHAILREVIPAYRGVEVSTAGDSFFVVFASASDAVSATIAMQRALAAHDWDPHPPIKVRMGLHTGEATIHDGDYAGLTVHAASRVESAASGGQVLITEATAVADILPEGVDLLDLGMHRLKDLPSELHLYQLVAAGLERSFPPVRGLDVLRNNVPIPVSSFVGRTEALTKLHRFLDEDRLLTLFGPGGAGKTRLSLKLAEERLHRYRHGVWFVELDPAFDADTVTGVIANVFGVKEEQGKSLLDAIIDHLRDLEVLIVLDNCEHLIDVVARMVERILRAAPTVRVLATSREPLSISGERVWPIPPLSTEGDDPEAVRLLVDRVQHLDPDFVLTPEQLVPAQAISRRLDGLPLALELAAASAIEFSLEDIATQLDDRFALLTRGSRTALDRQKTLWGAIDWSYSLLKKDQRTVLRRIGVFPADFDYESATGVCGDDELDVKAILDMLAHKSLVAVTASGRFRMLESIRAYAREHLDEGFETAPIFERHARWFATGLLAGEEGPSWARTADGIDFVYDDLVAALSWTDEHDGDLALEILQPMSQFWLRRGRWTEGRMLAGRTLDATRAVRTEARAASLVCAADLALVQGDAAGAKTYFEENVALSAELQGETWGELMLGNLGGIAAHQGDFETAEEMYLKALDAAREVQPSTVPFVLAHLADISRLRGDLEAAWRVGNEALASARALDNDAVATSMVNLLGAVAQERGDLAMARQFYGEALETARHAGDTLPVPYLLFCLATVALSESAGGEAGRYLLEAVTQGRDLESREDLAESLEATSALAELTGNWRLARALLASVDALREAIGFPRPPPEAAKFELARERLRAGPGDFEADWATGSDLPLDDAIEAALDFLRTTAPPPPAATS